MTCFSNKTEHGVRTADAPVYKNSTLLTIQLLDYQETQSKKASLLDCVLETLMENFPMEILHCVGSAQCLASRKEPSVADSPDAAVLVTRCGSGWPRVPAS